MLTFPDYTCVANLFLLQELDAIFEEYKKKRMDEVEALLQSVPSFGMVEELNAVNFVTSIDNEHHLVTIIVLVYDPVNAKYCDMMYQCVKLLASVYIKVG